MKAVIQRVKHASVEVDHQIVAHIKQGFLVLLGIEEKDDIEDIEWLSSKIIAMRIFNDEQGLMNLGLKEVNGDLLLVSQFTLHASTKKGNRPSFIQAAKPVIAIPLYEKMIEKLEEKMEKKIFKGIFGADMSVELCNDGPVTIIIDSKNKV